MIKTKAPGRFEAIQILFCGHKIETGKAMHSFQLKKGQLTDCPNGCGEQKTKQIESGKDLSNG
jgi:hypothetical protein